MPFVLKSYCINILFICHRFPLISALQSRLQQFDPDFTEGVSDESDSDNNDIEDEMASDTSGIENTPQVGKSPKESSQQVLLIEQDFKTL